MRWHCYMKSLINYSIMYYSWLDICLMYSGWCQSRNLPWRRSPVWHYIHKTREWIKSILEPVLGLWFKFGWYSSHGTPLPCYLSCLRCHKENEKKGKRGKIILLLKVFNFYHYNRGYPHVHVHTELISVVKIQMDCQMLKEMITTQSSDVAPSFQ